MHLRRRQKYRSFELNDNVSQARRAEKLITTAIVCSHGRQCTLEVMQKVHKRLKSQITVGTGFDHTTFNGITKMFPSAILPSGTRILHELLGI